MSMLDTILVLGVGPAGTAILRAATARGLRTVAVVRSPEKATRVASDAVVVAPRFDASLAEHTSARTHVVVTFPPDGETDARLDIRSGAITYLSSTSVYGRHRGVVDDATPVAASPTAIAARRLDAEASWRARGATILRCPALYGPEQGLHVRLLRGEHRIPGDGSGFVSRIHLDDLATFVLAAPRAPGETFVVGDRTPLPHGELVRQLCRALALPLPPSVPLEEVHESLRGDRRIDPSRALERLGVTLRYPEYALPR